MANVYKLIPVFILVIAAFLFMALHPKVESYRVVGKVETYDGNTEGLQVKYTQEKGLSADEIEELPYLDVRANGEFKGVLNLKAGGIVYFYTHKKGYAPTNKSTILERSDKFINVGTLTTSLIQDKLSYKNLNGNLPITIYKNKCLDEQEETLLMKDISYFKDLEILNASCLPANSLNLYSAKLNYKGELGEEIYFGTYKKEDGSIALFDSDKADLLQKKTLTTNRKATELKAVQTEF